MVSERRYGQIIAPVRTLAEKEHGVGVWGGTTLCHELVVLSRGEREGRAGLASGVCSYKRQGAETGVDSLSWTFE